MERWPQETPKNIIIRMPNWIGDAIMAVPVIADLKHHWPEAKLTAMCLDSVGQLLRNDPHINEIFSFKKPSGWLRRQQFRDLLHPIKHGEYDLGVLLTNSFSSAWWFWRGGVKNRIGYADHLRSFLLNKAVCYPPTVKSQHLVTTYKMLLEPLGIPLSATSPQLYLSQEEKDSARAWLQKYDISKDSITIGINPGAAYGSAKCWLPERFKELTFQLLNDPRVRILYFGDSASAPLVHSICNGMPEQVINLAGKTSIRELMALIYCCSVFLTNDSGPMHMAAALKVPLLALFGSTSDVRTSPYGWGKWIHKHAPCSPCHLRTCPIDFRCMKDIQVEEVYQEILNLLNSPSSSNP